MILWYILINRRSKQETNEHCYTMINTKYTMYLTWYVGCPAPGPAGIETLGG